ncbi:MAG: tripartite tricarboxylate transporter substrate-binding protein [Burkholderiales bacterium]
MSVTRRDALHSLLGLVGAAALPNARAQAGYPNAPIHMVIPVPAGGGQDAMMRMVGAKLTESWGQPVLVESKAGASGAIAAAAVAKSPADGYTFMLSYSAFLSNTVLQPNPGYKLSDFVPVAMLAMSPIAIGVRSSLGVNTLQELIALAKKQPGKLTFGSYGQGSGGHFVGEELNAAAGIDMVHVPYKGEAPALQDLVGGQIDAAITSVGGLSRFPDKIKPLALVGLSRSPRYKDVPTFGEAGLPAVDLAGWGGLFAPAGTPKAILNKVTAEVNRIILLPELAPKLQDLGFEPVGWGPDKMNAFLNGQLAKIKKLVDDGRVKV